MRRFVLLLIALACGAAAYAQVQSSEYLTYLLKYPSVRKDLGLSATATATILKAEKESEKRYFAMISPKPGSDHTTRPSMSEIQAEMKKRDAALLGPLSAAQKARLREIGIQYSGAFALGDLRISKQLGLSPDQIRKLQSYATASMTKLQAEMASSLKPTHIVGKGAPDPKANMAKLAGMRAQMMRQFGAEAAKVLTPAQNRQWKAMQGRPFPIETLYTPAPAFSVPVKKRS